MEPGGAYKRIGRELLDVFTTALRHAILPDKEPHEGIQGEHGPFQYTPLASPACFRILHLTQPMTEYVEANTERPLYGSLIQAQIDSHPEYYALSYTWGDSTLCETIKIDGKRLGITRNCAAALRRMLRGKAQRYIWVDSICINQANTSEALEERGRQVAMMDQIYRNAIQVNVHLGEGDPASDVACVALKSLIKYSLLAISPGPQKEFFRRKYESLADDVLAETSEYPYGKLHGVFRLPWFRRVWVVQEVVLGRNVMFYCGKNVVHFRTLASGADFQRVPYSKVDSNMTARHWTSYLGFHDAMNNILHRREEGEPLSQTGLKLSSVLLVPALKLEAARPVDKIFAFYGICKRLGFDLPAPDYEKPVAMIYTEAAQAILHYDQNLEVLSWICESPGWEWGLPSWVPDFSGCLCRWTPSKPPHLSIFGKGNPSVSGNTQCQFELILNGEALKVKGRRLDLLCASGLPWMIDSSTNLLGDSPLQTGQVYSSFLDCIGSWLDVVLDRGDFHDINAATQLLARVLTCDDDLQQQHHLSAENLEVYGRYLSTLVAIPTLDGDTRQIALADPQESLQQNVKVVGDYILSLGMYMFFQKIMRCQWKTVFRTLNGYLGIGTHTVRENDVVAVFHGCPQAAILRPCGDSFKYVGPAYVDGIMNGEFWGAGTPIDDEWFVLI